MLGTASLNAVPSPLNRPWGSQDATAAAAPNGWNPLAAVTLGCKGWAEGAEGRQRAVRHCRRAGGEALVGKLAAALPAP